MLSKSHISSLESLAGFPTPPLFSALKFAFLSTLSKWSILIQFSITAKGI